MCHVDTPQGRMYEVGWYGYGSRDDKLESEVHIPTHFIKIHMSMNSPLGPTIPLTLDAGIDNRRKNNNKWKRNINKGVRRPLVNDKLRRLQRRRWTTFTSANIDLVGYQLRDVSQFVHYKVPAYRPWISQLRWSNGSATWFLIFVKSEGS